MHCLFEFLINDVISDDAIEAWNPDNMDMNSRVVGKNKHLENLQKRLAPTMKKSAIVLIDDTERNCQLVRPCAQ